jgi:hypothetical protein
MGQARGVKTHALHFYESKADKDAKRGRMTLVNVTKGERSTTGNRQRKSPAPFPVRGLCMVGRDRLELPTFCV